MEYSRSNKAIYKLPDSRRSGSLLSRTCMRNDYMHDARVPEMTNVSLRNLTYINFLQQLKLG